MATEQLIFNQGQTEPFSLSLQLSTLEILKVFFDFPISFVMSRKQAIHQALLPLRK